MTSVESTRLDDPEQIKAVLDSGANVNLPGLGGQTPLFRSVLAGREKAVRALLGAARIFRSQR